MNSSILIGALAIVTLTIVAVWLVIERIGTEKAKDEHHHSAMTENKPEQRDG